ncbi:MAG: outer membrane beta-barrel protein [Candidatus Eisenbacteria bacterium]|nr:outer membrane beta-barrel protein [Candidatus Eisenbacteria bacterium]
MPRDDIERRQQESHCGIERSRAMLSVGSEGATRGRRAGDEDATGEVLMGCRGWRPATRTRRGRMFRGMLAVVGLMAVLALPGLALGADIGLYGVGGQVSYVSPEDIDGTFGLGVQADMGEIGGGFMLYPSVTFWSKSEDYGVTGCSGEWTWTVISLNADTKYYFMGDDSGSVAPYAGGGLAIIYAMSSWDYECDYGWYEDSYDDSDSDTDFGFNLFGGIDFPFSDSMTGFGEVRYTVGDIDALRLTGGVTFNLGG